MSGYSSEDNVKARSRRYARPGLTKRGCLCVRRVRGSIMPMVTVGMLALFGLAAVGLESGILFWDKARLQNAADAAALSAAKELDNTADTTAATIAGVRTFNLNASGPGNGPLSEAVNGGLTPTFEYSTTLNPFTPGAAAGPG